MRCVREGIACLLTDQVEAVYSWCCCNPLPPGLTHQVGDVRCDILEEDPWRQNPNLQILVQVSRPELRWVECFETLGQRVGFRSVTASAIALMCDPVSCRSTRARGSQDHPARRCGAMSAKGGGGLSGRGEECQVMRACWVCEM